MIHIKHFIRNLILINFATFITTEDIRQKEIEALEKEKSDLLKKIHSAIDDSVSLLQKDNNTQNVQGISLMLELKQQMTTLNKNDTDNIMMEEDSNSELENRRRMKKATFKANLREPTYTTLDKAFDINKVLFGKNLAPEKVKQLLDNRLAMQKRLDAWILQRELEKAKIREHQLAKKKLLQSGLIEKCPRFGRKKKKYNKKYRRYHGNCSSSESDSDRHRKRRKRRKGTKTYPCCRKCCKKSYMGCL